MVNERQYHIQVAPGEVGRYVLLPGDPGRCEPIARLFDEPHLVARHREYETWTGSLEGVPVSVTSTGIGCPSAAIAMEELVKVGADTFIRVGTSGWMQPDSRSGELAIVTAAIRDEGTSSHYLPIEFPAVADIDIVAALRTAARAAGVSHRVGVSHSKDSFYGEVEPHRMPMRDRLAARRSAWRAGGAICSEMEAAALFVVAATLGVRAGGIMQLRGDGPEDLDPDLSLLLPTAVAGLQELIRSDQAPAG